MIERSGTFPLSGIHKDEFALRLSHVHAIPELVRLAIQSCKPMRLNAVAKHEAGRIRARVLGGSDPGENKNQK
jgi:hypothetical protein